MTAAPPLPLAADFDRTLEVERARWLRRRFLWFCATLASMNLLFAPMLLMAGRDARGPDPPRADGQRGLAVADAVVGAAVCLAEFFVVLLRPPPRETMLRLATWGLITLGTISLLSVRLK